MMSTERLYTYKANSFAEFLLAFELFWVHIHQSDFGLINQNITPDAIASGEQMLKGNYHNGNLCHPKRMQHKLRSIPVCTNAELNIYHEQEP
jgi:hypothetical protein